MKITRDLINVEEQRKSRWQLDMWIELKTYSIYRENCCSFLIWTSFICIFITTESEIPLKGIFISDSCIQAQSGGSGMSEGLFLHGMTGVVMTRWLCDFSVNLTPVCLSLSLRW